ncbi:MAG: AAA family ATPase [Candidatus Micrarchaeaceae archaeon]
MKTWTEKYRPKRISEVVGQDEVKTILNGFLTSGEPIPHLLFYGSHGIGKTSMAEALANELGTEILEYNASKERGIDFIRETILDLSRAKSLVGSRKIIFLDEADELTLNAQFALRRIMEENDKATIFILSANDESKIIPPVRNRCLPLRFTLISDDQLGLLLDNIAQKEGITVPPDKREKIIKSARGSARSLILSLLAWKVGGVVNDDGVDVKEYVKIIKNKALNNIERLNASMRYIENVDFNDFVESFLRWYIGNNGNVKIVNELSKYLMYNRQDNGYIGKLAVGSYLILHSEEI